MFLSEKQNVLRYEKLQQVFEVLSFGLVITVVIAINILFQYADDTNLLVPEKLMYSCRLFHRPSAPVPCPDP